MATPTVATRVESLNPSILSNPRFLDDVSTSTPPDPTDKAAAKGPRSKKFHAVAGVGAFASARGLDACAATAGPKSHAKLMHGNSAEAVAAAGANCLAECDDSFAYMAAVGMGATAISHTAACPAVAVGYAPIAEAGANGKAVSIGSEPIAAAGPGGYLIFVDTGSDKPEAHAFKVGDYGIEPNVPYWFQSGMILPKKLDDLDEWNARGGSARWKAMRRDDIERASDVQAVAHV